MVIWLTRPSRCERSTLAERKTLADQGSQRQALPTRAPVKRPAQARSTSSRRSPRRMPAAPWPGRIGASRSSTGASDTGANGDAPSTGAGPRWMAHHLAPPVPSLRGEGGVRLGACGARGGALRCLSGTSGVGPLLELAGLFEALVPGDTLCLVHRRTLSMV